MSQGDWSQQPGGGGMAPPLEPMEYLGPPATKWPGVLGTISIVLASIGLLCYGCNSLSTMAGPMFVGMVPPEQQEELRAQMPQGFQLVLQIVNICVSFLLSLWLLIAGIGLVRRRQWGRGQHVGWAFVKIIFTVLSTVVGLLVMDETIDQINRQMSAQGPAPFTMTREIFMAIVVVMLVYFLIYPIFIILWFSRASIKDEVAQWVIDPRGAI